MYWIERDIFGENNNESKTSYARITNKHLSYMHSCWTEQNESYPII